MSEPGAVAKGHTDVAALSAGVVAVAVSLFITPGQFGIINLVISVTLSAVILAHVSIHGAAWSQSFAVAAVIGLTTLPAVGFLDEAARSRDPLSLLLGTYEWDCDRDPCRQSGEPESRVPDRDLAIGWIGFVIATCVAERVTRPRRARKPAGRHGTSAL